METLALKLVLTPALIGAASVAGRRWGPAVSGWLVGLPFTSAPIALFLALNEGPAFAATAAAATMGGAISQAAFCVTYGWLASRRGRLVTVGASCLAFAVSTAVLDRLALPLLPLLLAVIGALVAALRLMPAGSETSAVVTGSVRATIDRLGGRLLLELSPPRWDIPARMVVATAFVLLLTGIAPALGPRLTGLVAPFPLYAAVLAGFAHHLHGPASATGVLRGLLLGLFAFAGFFLVLAALIEGAGIVAAFASAIVLALALQAVSLWALRRGQRARIRRCRASVSRRP